MPVTNVICFLLVGENQNPTILGYVVLDISAGSERTVNSYAATVDVIYMVLINLPL